MAARKRAPNDELSAIIAAQGADARAEKRGRILRTDHSVSPELACHRKQVDAREREKHRKRPRVSGFKVTKTGMVARTTPAAAPGPEDAFARLTDRDREIIAALDRLLERVRRPIARGDFEWPSDEAERRAVGNVSRRALERVRAAYAATVAADGEPWLRGLRAAAVQHLRYRLGGKLPPASQARIRSGAEIVKLLRAKYPDAPRGLTGARVDRLLESSTLTRGGRGKRNLDTALANLASELRGQTRRR